MIKIRDNMVLNFTIILSILLTISHYINNAFLVLGVLSLFLIMTIAVGKKYYLPIMLFFLSWSGVMRTGASSHSFYTILQILYLILIVMSLFYKIHLLSMKRESIIAVIILLSVSMIAIMLHGYSFTLGYFSFIAMLFFVPLYLNQDYGIDYKECAIFYIIGIILASFAGLIFLKTSHMGAFITVTEHINIGISRISGLSGDSNGYAAELLVAIGISLIFILKSKKTTERLLYLVGIMICSIFGFMTLSKMFLIILILLFFIFTINLIFMSNIRYKGLLLIAIIGITCFFLSVPQVGNYIQMYQKRFMGISDVNQLSSGRSNIWLDYLKYIFENIKVLLFGNGFIRTVTVNGYAAHNTLIQILFQCGIIGTIGFIIWIKSLRKRKKNTYLTLFEKIILFIVIFIPWLSLDKLFFDDFFFMIMLYIVAIRK